MLLVKITYTDNKKIYSVVQSINKEGVDLQEEVQEAKQLRMQICDYLITELIKPKAYYKRLLDMDDNVKMYVYGFRNISTKCRTRYLLAESVFKVVVGIEKRHPVAKRKLVSFVL